MGPGLSSPRTGSQGHGRRDLILHQSGSKGKDKKRREKEPSMTGSGLITSLDSDRNV